MIRTFDFEAFYDFVEVLYELQFFFEGTARIHPFNYLEAYQLLRRSVDAEFTDTEAERMLYEAICVVNTTHPAFNNLRYGKTTDLKEDILYFIDELDSWRVNISSYFGLETTLSDSRAFCLLCEMYCDEAEPCYTSMYEVQKRDYDATLPARRLSQLQQDIEQARQAHFIQPTRPAKDRAQIDREVALARQKLHDWERKHHTNAIEIHALSNTHLSRIMLDFTLGEHGKRDI